MVSTRKGKNNKGSVTETLRKQAVAAKKKAEKEMKFGLTPEESDNFTLDQPFDKVSRKRSQRQATWRTKVATSVFSSHDIEANWSLGSIRNLGPAAVELLVGSVANSVPDNKVLQQGNGDTLCAVVRLSEHTINNPQKAITLLQAQVDKRSTKARQAAIDANGANVASRKDVETVINIIIKEKADEERMLESLRNDPAHQTRVSERVRSSRERARAGRVTKSTRTTRNKVTKMNGTGLFEDLVGSLPSIDEASAAPSSGQPKSFNLPTLGGRPQ